MDTSPLAFTVHYDRLKNRLISDAKIRSEEKELSISALWDTGATSSCISKEAVQKLGLIPFGRRIIGTAAGGIEAQRFMVDICLPKGVEIKDLPVFEADIENQGIDALIGMDIIQRGDLAVANFKSKTSFTYRTPSQEDIDFEFNNNSTPL